MSWTLRPRQRARMALGLCPDCGESVWSATGKRCEQCRAVQNHARRVKYSADRKAGVQRFSRERYRELADEKKEKREARKAAKLCIQCGKPATRFIRCTLCRAKNGKAKERHRMRLKAQAINQIRGVAA